MSVAIVTGGSSDIGRATAVRLAREGYDVGLMWHENKPGLLDTVAECRKHDVHVEARRMDLDVATADLPGAIRAIDELIDSFGGVDVFVSNAGGGVDGAFLKIDLDGLPRTINRDLTGSFLGMQRAAWWMVEHGSDGRIIAITSAHEHVPPGESPACNAATHGLGGLIRDMALEMASNGITVNAVAPGEIAARVTGQPELDPTAIRRPGMPLDRTGHAKEIANAVAWLASPESGYVTGHSFVIDGGMVLMAAMANQLTS